MLEIAVASIAFLALFALGVAQRTMEPEASGKAATLLWLPFMLLICYRSLPHLLFGIPFEQSMFWHGYISFLATAYGIWHGIASMYWAKLGDVDENGVRITGLATFFTGPGRNEFITGGISSALMLLVMATSIYPVRQMNRRLWLASHHLIPFAAVAFCVLHGAPGVLIGVVVYLADRLYGYLYQAWFQYRSMASQGVARVLPSGLVKLSFPCQVNFTPGQYMCIHIPSVSMVEYHAFSIASLPSDAELVFLVQDDGHWTTKLRQRIAEKVPTTLEATKVRAHLHGPHGSIGLDWQSNDKYDAIILIAGGIGIAPILPLYRHLAQEKLRGRNLRRVTLIWCVRSLQMYSDCVNSQVPDADFESTDAHDLECGNDLRCDGCDVDIYVTRKDADEQLKKRPRIEDWQSRVLGRVNWHQGRPSLGAVFSETEDQFLVEGTRRVAVLTCGPDSLTDDVCDCAAAASSRDVQFDVHREQF